MGHWSNSVSRLQHLDAPELGTGDEAVVEYFLQLPINMPLRQFYLHLNILTVEGEEIKATQAFNGVSYMHWNLP